MDFIAILRQIRKFCKKDKCQQECLVFGLGELKQQPCFRGDVGDLLRVRLMRGQDAVECVTATEDWTSTPVKLSLSKDPAVLMVHFKKWSSKNKGK